MIGCLEEIAWRNRWIAKEQFADLKEEETWLRRSAELGEADACIRLAEIYSVGNAKVRKNPAEAARYLQRARELMESTF